MTPVNKEVVARLFNEMGESLGKLKILSELTEAEFLSDSRNYDSAKYNLIVSIESLIDLCNHIIAQERLGKPEDYADVFAIIGKELGLDDGFIMTLQKMSKFRNLIVHLYWKVENKEVYGVICSNLDDFDIIRKTLRAYLSP